MLGDKKLILIFLIILISNSFYSKLSALEKFYNYYEKGSTFMMRKDWQRALEEYKSAASLEFKDAKKKRTYGTRFIEYFPHREIGIAHFYLGEYEKALSELKLSLAFKPSKRAAAFINKIKNAGEVSEIEGKSPEDLRKEEKERQAALEQERLAMIQKQEEERNKLAEQQKQTELKRKEEELKKKKFEQEQINKTKVPVGALTYDPSMVTQVGSRLSVAVLPFEGKGDAENLSKSVTDKMITQLVNLRRFRVIERNALEDVMKEQKFSLSGMVDENTAVELGKLVGADVIIFGSIICEENYGKVNARVIDTQTSETIVAKEASAENTKIDNIEKLVENVAIMIYNDLPLVEGNVVNVEEGMVYIDIGNQEGVRKGTKCVAFKEGKEIIHPTTKEVLGRNVKKLGEIIVVQVQEKMAIARIIDKEGDIKLGDKVVVK
ncbi:MAG: hypothetical protein H8E57_08650 [Candidatus Cloacimonetes bacterium]|nr:hypothetical protein [Candidatus Cloacimonadota bacterium]